VTVRRRAISAHTIPKTRISSVVAADKQALAVCKTKNELKPESANKIRSPKASIGSGADSTISGPPSLLAPTTVTVAMKSSSKGDGYENMRETEILNDELSVSRGKLPSGVVDSYIPDVAIAKRPRLEPVTLDANELERQQQRMLINFINSKETDLVDDIRCTTGRMHDVTRLLGEESPGDPQQNLQHQMDQASAGVDPTNNVAPEVGNTTSSNVDRANSAITAQKNSKLTSKVKSKSVGCCNAPNMNIVKPESGDDVRHVTTERRRYFRRQKNKNNETAKTNSTTAITALTVSSDSKQSTELGTIPMCVPSNGTQNRNRSLAVDRKNGRSKRSRLERSQSSVKPPIAVGSSPIVSAVLKVKRSATFGGQDVISPEAGGPSALLRRFRQRKKSLDGSSISLSGRAVGDDVEAAASTESFVTACGDSEFRLNVDKSSGCDVSSVAAGRGESVVVVGGCSTNSDNNVSAADESDRTTWPPSSSDAQVGRSSSSCTKDLRLPGDTDTTGSRRDLLSFPVVDDDDDGDDPFDIEDDVLAMRGRRASFSDAGAEAKVSVPISICLIIIGVYIIAGSALFAIWEDWDYLTGSYFCFITLSTIGFGDVVPGTDMDQWASHEKLVLCALWLAFGLSLLAMCFNLMQEEVKEKCKWLGRKLGLLKDEGAR